MIKNLAIKLLYVVCSMCNKKILFYFVMGLFALLWSLLSSKINATSIKVVGLFEGGAAVILVDGDQKLLKKNKPLSNGIELISVTSEKAFIKINDKIEEYYLDQSKSYTNTKQQSFESDSYFENNQKTNHEISIEKNTTGHFLTSGKINNFPVEFLVDTGASVIGLNKKIAEEIGLNYRAGRIVNIQTASGSVKAYKINLATVSVGGIVLSNVEAVVNDSLHPEIPLLGMSYLQSVELRYKKNKLFMKKSM